MRGEGDALGDQSTAQTPVSATPKSEEGMACETACESKDVGMSLNARDINDNATTEASPKRGGVGRGRQGRFELGKVTRISKLS